MTTDNMQVLDNKIIYEISPLLFGGESSRYVINRIKEDEWPFRSYTATSDMQYFYGTITSLSYPYCNVRGQKQEAVNAIIKDSGRYSIGDEVSVFEHMNIDGEMDVLATKWYDCNEITKSFVNIGWSSSRLSRFLRIDIYTGESKLLQDSPVPDFCRIK